MYYDVVSLLLDEETNAKVLNIPIYWPSGLQHDSPVREDPINFPQGDPKTFRSWRSPGVLVSVGAKVSAVF